MSSFDAFDGDEAAGPWNDDSYLRYNSRLPSQRLDAFSSFAPATADAEDGDDEYGIETVEPSEGSEMFSPSPAGFGYASGSGPELPSVSSPFSMLNSDGDGYVEVGDGDEPILPAPDEMGQDEGFVLREWRRQNVILLEEKEKKEKELRSQIIAEAEAYKRAFYEKRKVHCETLKEQNREREKLFIVNQENFHANAEKQYWKSISELIPREIVSIEKKGKKNQDKKPSVVIIQGPKLGKPTDLSRMRQILLKLKHSPPQHMKSPAPPETSGGGTTATNAAAMQAAPTISKETPLAPFRGPASLSISSTVSMS